MNKLALPALALCLTTGGVAATLPSNASAVTTATVTKQVAANTTLNVRTAPSTTSSVVAKLTGGTKITGTLSGSWFKITSGSYAGRYVSSTYLVTPTVALKTFNYAGVVAKTGQKVGYVMADPSSNGSKVNVRSAPSFSAAVVGTYAANVRVVGTPQADGVWWKVSGGYIHSAVLTTATTNPSTINAKIPTSQLCRVNQAFASQLPAGVIGYGYTTATPRYFQCKALPALNALEAAYKAHAGAYAGIDNAYRGWAEQTYWYDMFKNTSASVSAPGKSNHGFGLAVDFQNDYSRAGYPNKTTFSFTTFRAGGAGRAWLLANAKKYGFADIGTSDAVHWNFVG